MYRYTLLFVALCSFTFLHAEKDYNSGSLKIDFTLSKISEKAKADITTFKANLSEEFEMTAKDLEKLFDLKMDPAEVYLSLEIMRITDAPLGLMIAVYENDHHKGWEFLAEEMGIKVDSAESHELKDAVRMMAYN